MKKLVGGLFRFIAFVAMFAGLAVVSIGMAYYGAAKIPNLPEFFTKNASVIPAIGGAIALILMIVGTLINNGIGKKHRGVANFLTLIFGGGLFAAFAYLLLTGERQIITAIIPFLGFLKIDALTSLANDKLIYIAAGVVGGGILLTWIARIITRPAKAMDASAQGKIQQSMQPSPKYTVTSRDSDRKIAQQPQNQYYQPKGQQAPMQPPPFVQQPPVQPPFANSQPYSAPFTPNQQPQNPNGKIERYVRDPWGNLIREEDYNERFNNTNNRR